MPEAVIGLCRRVALAFVNYQSQQFGSSSLITESQPVLTMTLQLQCCLAFRVSGKLPDEPHKCKRLLRFGRDRIQTLLAFS